MLKEIYKRFLRVRSLERVRKYINAKHQQFLSAPLSRYQIRRILSDPVYFGRPEHLGEVVVDSSLAYIDEDTYLASLKALEGIWKKYKPQRVSPIRELVVTYGVSALEFLDQLEFHHKRCGGLVTKNGTVKKEIRQQIFLCKKCSTQWKIPTKNQLKKIQEFSRQGSIKCPCSLDSIFPLAYESDSLSKNSKQTKKPEKNKNKEKESEEKTRNTTLDELSGNEKPSS